MQLCYAVDQAGYKIIFFSFYNFCDNVSMKVLLWPVNLKPGLMFVFHPSLQTSRFLSVAMNVPSLWGLHLWDINF